MSLPLFARLTGLVGGLLWLLRLVLDLAGTQAGEGVLRPAGFVLLGLALAAAGALLVSSSAAWLRVIVAVAFPLLVWSVLEVIAPATDAVLVHGITGVVAIALALRGARRTRSAPARSRRARHAGAHAR